MLGKISAGVRMQNGSLFGMTYLREGKTNLRQHVQKDFEHVKVKNIAMLIKPEMNIILQ